GFDVAELGGPIADAGEVAEHLGVAVPPGVVRAHVEGALVALERREEEHVEVLALDRADVVVETGGRVLRDAAGQRDGAVAGAGQEAGGALAAAHLDEAVLVEAGEDPLSL